MRTHYRIFCISFAFLLLMFVTPVFAKESSEIETHIAAGLGIEYLEYEEQLDETALKSSADVTNIVFQFEGMKRWKNIFIGFQGVIPVVNSDCRERWFVNAVLDQTDSLKYGIVRFAPFIGFSFTPLFNPYLGTGSTWSNQKRSDFRTHDGSIVYSSEITEKVFAQLISFGFRGGLPVPEKWHLIYGAEYSLPYYSKVTNDGLPGWEATGIEGYLWRVYGELRYVFRETFAIGLLLSTGNQHWEGSGWQNYNGEQVKWPGNDTFFFNSFLNFNWYF